MMKSTLFILLIQHVLQCSGQTIVFPGCSICRTGETIGLPDVVAPSATVLGSDLPCGQIEANASNGLYRPAICLVLRFQLPSVCSCTVPTAESPTAAPVAGVTAAPVATVTAAPVATVTEAPVASGSSTTLAPSVAPTSSPISATAAPTSSPIDGTMAPASTTAPATTTTSAPVAATSPTTNATTDAPTTSPVMVNTTTPTAGTTTAPTSAPVAPTVNTTTAPTSAPVVPGVNATTAPTSAPAVPAVNATTAPTSAPVVPGVNMTFAPTSAPAVPAVNTTFAPTSAPAVPAVNTTSAPTSAPVAPAVNTTAPIAVTPNTTAPTMAPTISPSATKVVNTTAPSMAPVVSTTASPVVNTTTSVPSAAPVVGQPAPSTRTVESTTFIRLGGLTTELSDEATTAFEEATTEYLKEGNNRVTNETCTVVNQKMAGRRVLQETNVVGVEVEVKCVGESDTVASEDFGIQTRSTLETEGYKTALKAKDPVFEQITDVAASQSSTAPPDAVTRTVESTTFIRLNGVTTELSDEATSAFEEATTEYLKEGNNGVTNETCTVVNQKMAARRVLQETNKDAAVVGIEVEVKCVGESDTVASDDFGIQTRSALETEGYKTALKAKDPVFEQITDVAASQSSTAPPDAVTRTVDSTAFIRLDGVTTELSDEATSAFEEATTEYLKEGNNGVTNETCTVVNQKVAARRALRVLQETSKDAAVGVEVEVKCVGESDTVDSKDFGIQTRSALETEGYKTALKAKDPVFQQITKVVISEKSEVGSSEGRDIDLPAENNGLKAGIIFVIILGFMVAVCSIVGGAYYLIRSGSPSAPTVAAPIQEYPVEQSAGPSADIPESSMKSGGAAAAAAPTPAFPATSEVESTESKEPSVIKSLAGESEMEGYSVAAGQIDGGTIAGQSPEEGTSASPSGDEMSSHAMSSLKQNMVSRTVIAPPGKLGIVIDTTLEGPVVHKVNAQSPLEGSLFSGDIIVAIDDVDTRAMSASAITALMVRTANLRRTLTVLSEDNST